MDPHPQPPLRILAQIVHFAGQAVNVILEVERYG